MTRKSTTCQTHPPSKPPVPIRVSVRAPKPTCTRSVSTLVTAAAALAISSSTLVSSFTPSLPSSSLSLPLPLSTATLISTPPRSSRQIHHSSPHLTRFKSNIGIRMSPNANDNDSSASATNPLMEMGLPPLVLGSGSFTRKLILKEMNIPFILKVKPIDERNIGDRTDGSDPKSLVMTLAKAKGDALVEGLLGGGGSGDGDGDNDTVEEKYNLNLSACGVEMEEYIVLTADQVVTCNNSILEKPDTIDQAKEFVAKYGTNPPSTVGAVVLTHIPSMISTSGVDTAQINFSRRLSDDASSAGDLIDRLLKDDAPVLSCAGGLMVEHPFVKEYIDGIDGTEDSVMGLSKDLVLTLMREMKAKLGENA